MLIYRNMIELSGDMADINTIRTEILNKPIDDVIQMPESITDDTMKDNWQLSTKGYRGKEIVLSWLNDTTFVIDTLSHPCKELINKLHEMYPSVSFMLTYGSDIIGRFTGVV